MPGVGLAMLWSKELTAKVVWSSESLTRVPRRGLRRAYVFRRFVEKPLLWSPHAGGHPFRSLGGAVRRAGPGADAAARRRAGCTGLAARRTRLRSVST